MSRQRPSGGVVRAETDDESLTIVRIFDASREEVFEAWTDPTLFAQWFGEHGSSVPADSASMDVRPGGAWRVVMLLGPGSEMVFSGRFVEVEAPTHLVLTLTDREPEDAEAFEVLTVDLEDLGDGSTQMTFIQSGGNLPPAQYEVTLRGWLVFFERQDDLLKARHDTDS